MADKAKNSSKVTGKTRGRKPGSVNNNSSYAEEGNQSLTSNEDTVVQTPKYIDLLLQDEDSAKQEQAELDNDQAKINLATEQFTTKKQLLEAARNLTAAKRAVPFNAQNIYTLINNVSVLERKAAILDAIEAELF